LRQAQETPLRSVLRVFDSSLVVIGRRTKYRNSFIRTKTQLKMIC